MGDAPPHPRRSLALPPLGSRTIGRRLLGPALVLIVLIALAGAATLLAFRGNHDAAAGRAKARQVTTADFETLRALLDADAGVREYLTTGRRRSLSDWAQASRAFELHAARLAELERRDPVEARIVAGIRHHGAKYFEHFVRPVLALRSRGPIPPAELVRLHDEGARHLDAVRRLSSGLIAAEEREVGAAVAAALRREDRALLVAALAFAASVLIGIWLAVAVARDVVAPVRRLQWAVDRLARGDRSVRVRVSPIRELTAVAHGVNVLGERLAQRDAAIAEHTALLERRVAERTLELEATHQASLRRLAVASEFRDDDTHEHTARVGAIAAALGRELGLSDVAVDLLRQSAPLHDVGKLGVPDAILLKPGPLTPEERGLMQLHTLMGARILADSESPVLKMAEQIALSHHERWDGAGYPHGLSGSRIPLPGRIVAVADVFDALTHSRPYKEAWSVESAVGHIRSQAGEQFDPEVVAAFERLDHEALHAGPKCLAAGAPGRPVGLDARPLAQVRRDERPGGGDAQAASTSSSSPLAGLPFSK